MRDTFSVNMEKVDELRLKKFWTYSELGIKAHLTHGTIYSLKAKRRNASMLTVKKLAAALDVSPAEIIEK